MADSLNILISQSMRTGLDGAEARAQIFDLGCKALEAGNSEQAARLLHEAARSYRIEAYKQQTQREVAESQDGCPSYVANDLELVTTAFKMFGTRLKTNRNLPNIDVEVVKNVVEMFPLLDLMAVHAEELGVDCSSQGNSILRKVVQLALFVFGEAGLGRDSKILIEDPFIRAGLELISDEVERRHSAANSH